MTNIFNLNWVIIIIIAKIKYKLKKLKNKLP